MSDILIACLLYKYKNNCNKSKQDLNVCGYFEIYIPMIKTQIM